jgi:hypothetical protein
MAVTSGCAMYRTCFALGGALLLSACATARFHSVEEINSVGQQCGVAVGEVFQDESEKRLLFLMRPDATQEQRLCVLRWARKNHLKFVFVNAINFPEN